MSSIPDKYDIAVEYFTKSPGEILAAWRSPMAHQHGCLFQFLSPDGATRTGMMYGCVTEVKDQTAVAFTKELTDMIRADPVVLRSGWKIKPSDLPALAKYQKMAENFRGKTEEMH